MTNKLVAEGKEGPLGEPPLPIEGGIHTQGAGEREHEAQGRGGLLAVEKDNLPGTKPPSLARDGSYPEAGARANNASAERLKAPHRGVDIIRACRTKDVDYYGVIQDSVGYILLNDFTDKSFSDFKTALTELKDKGIKRLIIDLRNNF